jgi:3-hydroxyacyl-[acyl-carrier-protein] dehydratase
MVRLLYPFMGESRIKFVVSAEGPDVRFTLIDRIVAIEPGTSLKAVKNLSLAEEYLADHFPGFPVMPGVLMVESLVQAGAWLMRHTENFQYSAVLLKEARAIRFNNFVAPGRTLHVECSIHKREERIYTLKGSGTVDGASAVSAKLILEQFNLADNNPELRASDERRIKKMRDLFDALWQPETATAAS